MPRYYGMYLDVQERLGIVFGGDAHEGQRKVGYLLECGATVKLFSPEDEISPKLRAQADADKARAMLVEALETHDAASKA